MPRRQEIGRKKFDRDVSTIRTKFPQWKYLTTPIGSTSWDGDSFSTTAKTLIDVSATFSGIPAGIRAILVSCSVRDSGSNGTDCWLMLSPNNAAASGFRFMAERSTNDELGREGTTVPCNADGDVYYQIQASGVGTLDAWIYIWGYAI